MNIVLSQFQTDNWTNYTFQRKNGKFFQNFFTKFDVFRKSFLEKDFACQHDENFRKYYPKNINLSLEHRQLGTCP